MSLHIQIASSLTSMIRFTEALFKYFMKKKMPYLLIGVLVFFLLPDWRHFQQVEKALSSQIKGKHCLYESRPFFFQNKLLIMTLEKRVATVLAPFLKR